MNETALLRAAQPDETQPEAAGYLALLGDRVRDIRARRGMTRKTLARESGVSERYLAQLEAGQGNISVLLLRQLASALDTPIQALVLDGPEPSLELTHTVQLLGRLSPEQLAKAHDLLRSAYSETRGDRRDRIALVGLRGAGKSTLGAELAAHLGAPFVELDREIEVAAGAPLGAIFDLYGQAGFRRLERRCLERVLTQHARSVIATGGGLVSDPVTFERLLADCYTVWVRASPGEHMARVVAQGDMRPMANNREAMADLQRILRSREGLYGKADAQVDTTRRSVAQSLAALVNAIVLRTHDNA